MFLESYMEKKEEYPGREKHFCLFSTEKKRYYCGSCRRVKWHIDVRRARWCDIERHLYKVITCYGDYEILKNCIIYYVDKGEKISEISVQEFLKNYKH
jgi:hypothetical protein